MDYDKIQFDGQTRESGIECIKIFAMILMITGHVIQTLALENTFISYQDYVLDLSHATKDIQLFMIV